MPGSNQFKALATSGGANTLTPAAYAALTTLLANGFQSGTASSQQINTTLRQATFVIAAIAQAIADMTGVAVNDDGVIANFENQFLSMLQQGPYSSGMATGTSDALLLALTPALTSLVNGQSVLVRAALANSTTTPTLAVNSLGARIIVKGQGQALVAGDIAGAGHWLDMQYDQTFDRWVLQNPAKGVSSVASALGYTPYNATNPAGYINSGGALTGVTQAPSDNSINLATTAQVQSAIALNELGGSGQSWQNMTGSRASGTTYTNSTGRPIYIHILSATVGGGAGSTDLYINGIYLGSSYGSASNQRWAISGIVPAGGTYVCNIANGLSSWMELR